MAKHNQLGKQGELLAESYLLANGYNVLERNWQFERAEIDLILQKDGLYIFAEVKTRSTNWFGYPEEAVGKEKQENLARAAEEYIEQNQIDSEIRFDIIAIVLNEQQKKIHHIEDAFFPTN